MQTCYVYYLLDPTTSQPFYVGKSKNSDGNYSRANYHLKYNYSSDAAKNPHKYNKIQKLRSDGHEPRVVIVANHLTENEASETERQLIALHGRAIDGGILTNIGKGGEGNTSNHRAVDMYDMYGEYIQTFDSLLSAATYCGKNNSSSIVECCNHKGKSKSAWGYLWAYSGQPLDLNWCWSNSRPIVATHVDSNKRVRFVSASSAAKSIVGAPALITKACRTHKPYKGYKWEFYNPIST